MGPNCIHPHPSTPENTLLGVGVYKRGGKKFNTNFFSQTFQAPPGYPSKISGYPKKFDFPGFEGHTELFGTHPFSWKPPPHRKISGLKSLSLCSLTNCSCLSDWNLLLASILPHFILPFTHLNLYLASASLGISNHNLETMAHREKNSQSENATIVRVSEEGG